MLISDWLLNAQLKDYHLTLKPKTDFLEIKGRFEIESKFFIPSKIVELSYIFPSQKIDRLFLQTTGEQCQPSSPSLFCFVYTNLAQANLDKDLYFNSFREEELKVPLVAQFSLNSIFNLEKNLHNTGKREFFWSAHRQFENFSFKQFFGLKHKLKKTLSLREENSLEFEFTKELELKKYEKEKNNYQSIHIDIPRWEEILDKGIFLNYAFTDSQTIFKLDKLSGIIRRKGEKEQEFFSLSPDIHSQSVVLSEQIKSKLQNYGSTVESIELELSFSNRDDIKVVQLSLITEKKNLGEDENLMLYINPIEPLFKEISFDSSWIIEPL